VGAIRFGWEACGTKIHTSKQSLCRVLFHTSAYTSCPVIAHRDPELSASEPSAACSLVTAQGQWAVPYDKPPSDCLFKARPRSEKCEAGRGRAEGSHHRHHGVFWDLSGDHRHHGVFGESSLATSLLVSIGLAPNLSVTTQRIPYPEGACRGRLGRRPLVGYLN
jgi:hypothetical protein